jgi:hypothetical protein
MLTDLAPLTAGNQNTIQLHNFVEFIHKNSKCFITNGMRKNLKNSIIQVTLFYNVLSILVCGMWKFRSTGSQVLKRNGTATKYKYFI